jgi:hypothetical protein
MERSSFRGKKCCLTAPLRALDSRDSVRWARPKASDFFRIALDVKMFRRGRK